MLRECGRVLRTGGRLAVLVTETAEGLSAADAEIAAELGPTNVRAEDSLERMVAAAGLLVSRVQDETAALGSTVDLMRELLRARESELRTAEGDEAFEAERARKERMLEAIERGLIRRTLVVAEKPPR